MFDKAILGLLRLRPMTAYEVAAAMKRSTSFFYNASQGSIHPALKNLLRDGLASCKEEKQNGRLRKRYAITAAGESRFFDWLGSPLTVNRVKDDLVLRLFFLGALPKPARQKVLAGYRAELDTRLAEIEALAAESHGRAKQLPAELRDVGAYQLHTLDFGQSYYRFVARWMDRLIAEERD